MTESDLAAKNVRDILLTALTCLVQIDAGSRSLMSLKAAFSLLIFSQLLRQCGTAAFSSKCLAFMELINVATKVYRIVTTLADPTTAAGERIVSSKTPVNQLYHVEGYLKCIEYLRIAMIQHRQRVAKKNISYTEAYLLHNNRGVYVEIGRNILLGDVNVKGMLDDLLHQFDTLQKELSAIIMPTFTEPKFGQ